MNNAKRIVNISCFRIGGQSRIEMIFNIWLKIEFIIISLKVVEIKYIEILCCHQAAINR